MKIILLLTFCLFCFDLLAFPLGVKGQNQATPLYPVNIQAPNKTVTSISGGDALIETGNKNILENPSFQHQTTATGWTVTGVTASDETSDIDGGLKAIKFTTSGDTGSLVQDSTLNINSLADGAYGSLTVRAKNSANDAQVCFRQAGNNSICQSLLTDNKWRTYHFPSVLFGATSNGVGIEWDNSTGTTIIGSAVLQLDNPVVQVENITRWVDYGEMTITATTTNPTKATTRQQDNVRCRQVGEDYECEYRYRADASTGSAAGSGGYLFSLPSGIEFSDSQPLATIATYTGTPTAAQVSDQTFLAAKIGDGSVRASLGFGAVTGEALAVSGNRFQFIALQSYSSLNTTHLNSSIYALSNANLSYFFRIKFKGKGLEGASSVIASRCENLIDCETVFSAKVSSTDVVSSENLDWINGDCTDTSSTGAVTCNFNSGIFTVAPNCAFGIGPGGTQAQIIAISASAISYSTYNSGGILTNAASEITCTKQGEDYKRAKINYQLAQLKASNVDGGNDFGAGRKMKTCQYAFGGAGSLASQTRCTTSPCTEYFDSCDALSAPTRSAEGDYTGLSIANGTFKASSLIKCECEAYTTGASKCLTRGTSTDKQATNANGGYSFTVATTNRTGDFADAHVTISCTAERP